MRSGTCSGIPGALLAGLLALAEAQAQPTATKLKKHEKPPAVPAVSRAVAELVQGLRRWPVRPAPIPRYQSHMALYLVDLKEGHATLIASEPDPRLDRIGSPVWSHDGKTILFHASGGSASAPIDRLKTLTIKNGRPVLGDLGPGLHPDLSPRDDQILFFHRTYDSKNPGGIFMMNADSTHKRLLGDVDGSQNTWQFGRCRFSPTGHKFLISNSLPHGQFAIVDLENSSTTPLILPGRQIRPVPSWIGPDEILASLWPMQGNNWEIGLLDVSSPAKASIKEIWWTQKNMEVTWPTFPIYHPGTGLCAFVGVKGNNGDSIYVFEPGNEESLRRVEKEGLDNEIRDLVYSPDGRYVLFCSTRGGESSVARGRAQSAVAPVLSGITIDGNLADWPAAMPRHPIQNLHQFPDTHSVGPRQNAFTSTSTDLSACFMAGYSPQEQLLYVAVIVRDDKLVVGHTSPRDTDSVEIYVDGMHNDLANNMGIQPTTALSDNEILDAASLPFVGYVGIPGKGRVYGVKKSAGVDRGQENPLLMYGDIKKTKTRMAFVREGDVTTYEWAVQVFDQYPDSPTNLAPGVQLGFDIVILDRDTPAQAPPGQREPEQDRPAWLSWGPVNHTPAIPLPGNLGELILGRPADSSK